jgi:hypothetical protein
MIASPSLFCEDGREMPNGFKRQVVLILVAVAVVVAIVNSAFCAWFVLHSFEYDLAGVWRFGIARLLNSIGSIYLVAVGCLAVLYWLWLRSADPPREQ